MSTFKRNVLFGLLLVVALVAAYALVPRVTLQAQDDGLVIGMSVHSDPTGSFWNVVDRGLRDAGEDLGVTVISNGSSDPVQQAQFIEDYVAQGVDGIIVSLANPDAVRDAVNRAVEAGIPVVTINSGAEVSADLGAIMHVGQTEFVAGQGAGGRLNELGATRVLCVIHEEANVGLEQRCDGLADTFGGEVERFNVASTGVSDLAGTSATIQDRLTADSSYDAILALNPDVAIAARDAIAAAGGGQTLATFDLSPAVLDAIDAGEIAFAIDQQQYLQGYLPVVLIQLYVENLNVVGGGLPVYTGPGFVDSSNAASVRDLADAGTR
jgi:simple sugar transport system substrate-binding protein